MSPSAFSLAGFERVDGADFAQSWLVSRTRLVEVVGELASVPILANDVGLERAEDRVNQYMCEVREIIGSRGIPKK